MKYRKKRQERQDETPEEAGKNDRRDRMKHQEKQEETTGENRMKHLDLMECRNKLDQIDREIVRLFDA